VNKTHSFTITVAGTFELTDDIANALYEAGCDDASVRSEEPTVYLDFHRQAESLGDAIGSAVKNVQAAGYAVARIDVEEEPTASS
jgi:hypothetical protein